MLMHDRKARALVIIILILLLTALAFASYFLYQNWPSGETEYLKAVDNQNGISPVSFGETKQFYPSMRFSNSNISYSIDSSCSEEKKASMKKAFDIIEEETGVIYFYLTDEENADVSVGCSKEYKQYEKNVFIAGEGGPTEIINASAYYVILNGKVLLYKQSACSSPVVELHELLHVLGFDHSKDPNNIMYNFSSCEQKITQDIITTLISLYSIDSLPDLYISDINASKRGRYLDFNIGIKNIGLTDSGNTVLSVIEGDKEIDSFQMESTGFGETRILSVKNLKLTSRAADSVKFIIDRENKVKELREENNEITISVR